MSADGLRGGDAEGGEVIKDGDADLTFSGLAVEIAAMSFWSKSLKQFIVVST